MLDNTSSLCTKEYIERANFGVLPKITTTTPTPRLRGPNGSLCKPSKYSVLVNNTPPSLLLSTEDLTVVSRYAEELKRVKVFYYQMFKSFNAEIHSSNPLDFPMFSYSFVQFICEHENAPLTWNIFVSNSKVLCIQDLQSLSASAASFSQWHIPRDERSEKSECHAFLLSLEDDHHSYLRRFHSNTNRHAGSLSNQLNASLGTSMSRQTLFRDKKQINENYRDVISDIMHQRIFHSERGISTVDTTAPVPEIPPAGSVPVPEIPSAPADSALPITVSEVEKPATIPPNNLIVGCDDFTRIHLNNRHTASSTAGSKPAEPIADKSRVTPNAEAVSTGNEHRWSMALFTTTDYAALAVHQFMHFDNTNIECAIRTARKIAQIVVRAIVGNDFLSTLFDIKASLQDGNALSKADFLGSRNELTKSSIEARSQLFDYGNEDAKARANRWKMSGIMGISSPNPLHSFWDTVRVLLHVVTNPVVLKQASLNLVINVKGDNPFTLMAMELCLVGRLHGLQILGDLLRFVDDADQKFIPLVAEELKITVDQAVEKVAQVCTTNLLFHGPGHLHHMINNCVKLVQSWFFLFTKIAKDVLGKQWVLIFNVKPLTAQLLVWTLWSAYLECRENVHEVLLNVMCLNRFDAAALNHMLEFTLPMCIAPYNIHVRNNLGKGFFEDLRHMQAFKYCTEERQNYQYASLHSAAMLDHIRLNCPELYEHIIAHPIEQDEGDFEGGVFGGISRNLINWQKDADAIKFVQYECYINATAPHRAIDAAGRPGKQGRAKATEKDMSGAITRAMVTLKELVHAICSSDAPLVVRVKQSGASGTAKTSLEIPAFSSGDTKNKPAVYDVDKIGSPAYVFSWRYRLLFLKHNPHVLENSQYRAANGCQGCSSNEPAHGGPPCLALAGVPVYARGCGHVICATGDRLSCWICSKMVEHDALKKLRTRMNHLATFKVTSDTLKTQGYRLASGITVHGPKGPGGTPNLTVGMFDQMVVSKTWTNNKLKAELQRLDLTVSGNQQALKERLRAALLKAASNHAPIAALTVAIEPAVIEADVMVRELLAAGIEPAVAIAPEPAVAITEPAVIIDDDYHSDDSEAGSQFDESGSENNCENESEGELDNAVVDERVDGTEVLGNDRAQASGDSCETVKREVIKTELMATFQRLRPHIKQTLSKPIAAAVAAAVKPPMRPSPQDPTGLNPNPGDASGDVTALPHHMDIKAPVPAPLLQPMESMEIAAHAPQPMDVGTAPPGTP